MRRLGWVSLATVCLLLSVGARPPERAAPWVVLISGEPLPRRVFLTDWHENQRLLVALGDSVALPPAALARRRYLAVALFWGAEWAPAYRPPLARLRPEQANQLARFYPAVEAQPALLEMLPPHTRSDAGRGAMRILSADGLQLLARYGIPVRWD